MSYKCQTLEIMDKYIVKTICIVGVFSFMILIIACNVNSGNAKNQKTPMNDTLKIEGCQEKIKMKAGSIVEIKLEAVPGTGYQWLLKDSSQLLQLLDPDNLKFSYPESGQPAPGQHGHQTLHFKAIKKGEELIRLEYKRTWEKEVMNSCVMKVEIN
jgi:predicted secreted protein